MCGRYVLVQKVKVIEKRFNVKASDSLEYSPSYNIGIGQKGLVIPSDNPRELETMVFGLTPFWSEKKTYFFNARAEGDHNKEDNPEYRGAKGIINKPAFRKPIRSQRCLVIADCFIEGPKDIGLDEPYLVYLKNERPFAFAGIWDEWEEKATGIKIKSFAIITVPANGVLQKINHPRCPVILKRGDESKWVNEKTALSDITSMLKTSDTDLMNAFRISSDIKDISKNNRELLNPVGERLFAENLMTIQQDLELHGMGHYKPKKRNV